MAFNASVLVVFALFPEFITLFYYARISQIMAVAAEKLGLRDIRLGKLGLERPLLVG
jgi:hypothetical protein